MPNFKHTNIPPVPSHPFFFPALAGGCGKIVYLKNLVCLVRNISETADYRLFLWFENEVSQ